MSYPTIGMPGVVPNDDWSPTAIEDLLRSGIHINVHGTDLYMCFGLESGKFEVRSWSHRIREEDPYLRQFDTFIELASWAAFMGSEFI